MRQSCKQSYGMAWFIKFALTLFLLGESTTSLAQEACQWDGLKKVVWIDDLDQSGIKMPYPLPHDHLTRQLTASLIESGKYIVNSRANNDLYKAQALRGIAQIWVQPRLLQVGLENNPLFPVLGVGSRVEATLQVSLIDNFSGETIDTFVIRERDRAWLRIFPISQYDLSAQINDMLTDRLPDIQKKTDHALDCVPFAAKVDRIESGKVYLSSGAVHNIKVSAKLDLLVRRQDVNSGTSSGKTYYQRDSVITIESVGPGTSIARGSQSVRGDITDILVVLSRDQ